MAANEGESEVEIQFLDPDEKAVLKFNFRAAAEFKKLTQGSTIVKYFLDRMGELSNLQDEGDEIKAKKIMDLIDEDDCLKLLYCGLLHERKSLTLEDCYELAERVPGETYLEKWLYIATVAMAALGAMMPTADPEAEKKSKGLSAASVSPATTNGTSNGSSDSPTES